MSTWNRPKALVTGGASFIGSHLSELRLADGWEVFALDDLSTSSIQTIPHLEERWDHLADVIKHARTAPIALRDAEALEAV